MANPRPITLVLYVAAFAALMALSGCLVKEKGGATLRVGGMAPPWDSTHFAPKHLDGYVYAGAESTFAVFGEIGRLDSMAGDRKDWKADPEAMDTLRVSQLFDSGFVFPPSPEASMAYAYDDTYRDDTLFRHAYGNGLFSQENPCATTYVLSDHFLHPARWLRAGLKESQIIQAMGKPLFRQPGVLRYLTRRSGATPPAHTEDSSDASVQAGAMDVFEGVNFYFQDDSLFAAVLQHSQPCH